MDRRPIVRGGQGRTKADVESDAEVVIGAALVLIVIGLVLAAVNALL